MSNTSVVCGEATNETFESRATHVGLEVSCLCFISLMGTLGNLMVIFSLGSRRKAYRKGNIFLINLACADLFISSCFLPILIANVISQKSVLPPLACKFIGYLAVVSCSCSMANISFIAINRYWAIVRYYSYKSIFSKRNCRILIAVTWTWSNLITLPALVGCNGIKYEEKLMICSWSIKMSTAYNVCLAICTCVVPMPIIGFCYWRLFKFVRVCGEQIESYSNTASRNMHREMALMKTLSVTIVVFAIFWLPFGLTVAIGPDRVPHLMIKLFAWLALSNSSVNFIIYGATNKSYRRAYKNLLYRICTMKCIHRRFKLWERAESCDVEMNSKTVSLTMNVSLVGRVTGKRSAAPSPHERKKLQNQKVESNLRQ